jgi:hypothetical protein
LFSLLETYFWWIDLAIAAGVTLFVVLECRSTPRGRWFQKLFWLAAPVVFYLAALRVQDRTEARTE